jgi:hypothetical protein
MATAILAAGACVLTGCGYAVTASDGTVFRQSEASPHALASALVASGARDLRCPTDELEVQRLPQEREYAVTGCGARDLYRVGTPALNRGRVELVSRSAAPRDVGRSEQRLLPDRRVTAAAPRGSEVLADRALRP